MISVLRPPYRHPCWNEWNRCRRHNLHIFLLLPRVSPSTIMNIFKAWLLLTDKVLFYCVRPTSTRPRTFRRSAWRTQSLRGGKSYGNKVNRCSSFLHKYEYRINLAVRTPWIFLLFNFLMPRTSLKGIYLRTVDFSRTAFLEILQVTHTS